MRVSNGVLGWIFLAEMTDFLCGEFRLWAVWLEFGKPGLSLLSWSPTLTSVVALSSLVRGAVEKPLDSFTIIMRKPYYSLYTYITLT